MDILKWLMGDKKRVLMLMLACMLDVYMAILFLS